MLSWPEKATDRVSDYRKITCQFGFACPMIMLRLGHKSPKAQTLPCHVTLALLCKMISPCFLYTKMTVNLVLAYCRGKRKAWKLLFLFFFVSFSFRLGLRAGAQPRVIIPIEWKTCGDSIHAKLSWAFGSGSTVTKVRWSCRGWSKANSLPIWAWVEWEVGASQSPIGWQFEYMGRFHVRLSHSYTIIWV